MNALKRFFPLSWKYADSVVRLIIGIIIYFVVEIIVGALIGLSTQLTDWIPLVGGLIAWVLGIVGSLIGLYTLAGIVILVLVFLKVLKD